jgi:hypothetical protein
MRDTVVFLGPLSPAKERVLDADEEVALIYERDTCRKLSEPLVNLCSGLRLALSAGVTDEQREPTLRASRAQSPLLPLA